VSRGIAGNGRRRAYSLSRGLGAGRVYDLATWLCAIGGLGLKQLTISNALGTAKWQDAIKAIMSFMMQRGAIETLRYSGPLRVGFGDHSKCVATLSDRSPPAQKHIKVRRARLLSASRPHPSAGCSGHS
jgi:hypothetical protein